MQGMEYCKGNTDNSRSRGSSRLTKEGKGIIGQGRWDSKGDEWNVKCGQRR
jgi:hypothetical protein